MFAHETAAGNRNLPRMQPPKMAVLRVKLESENGLAIDNVRAIWNDANEMEAGSGVRF